MRMDGSMLLQWILANEGLLWWLALGSAVTFIATLLVLPVLVASIPADYFAHDKRRVPPWPSRHPFIRVALKIIKNLVGIVLIVAGIAMLLLPGQGILTVLVGLTLVNFPGKYRFERWLVERPAVFKAITWLRVRTGRPPLTL